MAVSRLFAQEFFECFTKPEILYRIHKNPLLLSILSQINKVNTILF
jgi:hypothetical protein